MKTGIDGSVGGRYDATGARERDEKEGDHDPAHELWTLAVAQTLVERLPRFELPADVSAFGARSSPDPAAESAPPAPQNRATAPIASGYARESATEAAAASRADAARAGAPGRGGDDLPSELRAEVSDERFGRLQLHVARGDAGLDIVISVADARVKALIEAEQAILIQTLKDAGLRVASVQIDRPSRAGTALAGDRTATERPRAGGTFRQPGARWRTYPGASEEEDADGEGVDFTA